MGKELTEKEMLIRYWLKVPDILNIIEQHLNFEPIVHYQFFHYDMHMTAGVISEVHKLANGVRNSNEYPYDVVYESLVHVLETFFLYETTEIREDYLLAIRLLNTMSNCNARLKVEY